MWRNGYLIFWLIGYLPLPFIAHAQAQADETGAFAAYQLKMLLNNSDQHRSQQAHGVTGGVTADESMLIEQKRCEDHLKSIHELLTFVPQHEQESGVAYSVVQQAAIEQLIARSLKTGFDHDCYQWQSDLLTAFTQARIHRPDYRRYLFNMVASQEADVAAGLLSDVLAYALALRPLSDDEWFVVRTVLLKASHLRVRQVMAKLVRATMPMIADATKESTERVEVQQTHHTLVSQIDDIVLGLEQGLEQRVEASPMTVNYFISIVLSQTLSSFPEVFHILYMTHRQQITEPANIAPYMGLYLLADPSPKRRALVSLYFIDLERHSHELGRKEMRNVMRLFNKLRQREHSAELNAFLSSLLQQHKAFVLEVTQHASVPNDQRQRWFAFYES